MEGSNPWTHLLALMEDDSPIVHAAVLRKLRELGTDPFAYFDAEGIELNPHQRSRLGACRLELEGEWLEAGWERWITRGPELESFLCLVATLLSVYGGTSDPRRLLDEWARRYLARHPVPELESLVGFLFSEDGLHGDMDDYFAPRNSSLSWVLEHGTGLPITLCSALILVGRRVGVDVDGVAFPGHFLASAILHGRRVWIDAFDGGRLIPRGELAQALGQVSDSSRDKILSPAQVDEICARVLRNVVTSMERAEDIPRQLRAQGWLTALDERIKQSQVHEP